MQLITLCFVFVLSLCTFNVVKCQEVKCRLLQKEGTLYKPSGRSVFYPDDKLEIKCPKGFWDFFSKTTEKEVTCNDDGKWSSSTDCEQITCAPPDDTLVKYGRWDRRWRTGRFEEKKDYQCIFGYKPTNGATFAECTNDGTWTPNPLCQEITCAAPHDNLVSHTSLTRWRTGKLNDQNDYQCKPGYKPTKDATFAKCTVDGTWTPTPLCEEVKCRLLQKEGTLYKPSGRSVFYPDDKLEIKCPKGFWDFFSKTTEKEVTCNDDGKWSSSTDCEQITCAPPDDTLVKYGRWDRRWRTGRFEEKKDYQCRFGYKPTNGATFAECTNDGTWTPNPLCQEITCAAPHDNLVSHTSLTRWRTGKLNDQNDYQCKPGYKPTKDATFAKCTVDGTWTPTPLCEEVKCRLLQKEGTLYKPSGRSVFYPDDKLEIKCPKGFWDFFSKTTEKEVTCNDDGKWSSSTDCEQITCAPPDDTLVKYGRWDRRWRTGRFEEKKDYQCRFGYKPTNGATFAECTNDGTWTPNPLCQEITCAAPHDNLVSHTSLTRWRTGKLNDQNDYQCKPGYKPTKDATFAKCTVDGTWTPTPLCEEMKELCPPLTNGFIVRENASSSTFYYSCNENFKPSTGGWWGVATCKDKKLSGDPTCIGVNRGKINCQIPDIPNSKAVSQNNMKVTCKDGYTLVGMNTIKCTNGKWETPLPECKFTCGPPPKVDNAIVKIPYQKIFMEESRVNYECRKAFVMDGSHEITCINGIWTTLPTCKHFILCLTN
ncbi:complement factor H-like isoform X2 [Esox lucius]|uniref:complement factor H-like isoform X2 n=1 Tax=Esox lucius TaxID=8010 RepID=UPI001476A119|nr:complement factor H-like isoform X2 [Esox lucius]